MTFVVRIEANASTIQNSAAPFLLAAAALNVVMLYVYGGYNRIWSRTSGHEVQVIVFAILSSLGVQWVLDLSIAPRPVPLSVVLIGNLIAMMGSVAVRYRSRLFSGLQWRWQAIWHLEFPDSPIRVLVVGAGDAGQTTAWRMKHRAPEGSAYRMIGFVDDDIAKQGMYIEGCQVIGLCADIPRLAEQHQIDLIVVSIHNITGPHFREIVELCEQTAAQIKIVPDVFALFTGKQIAPLLRDIQAEDLLGRQTVGWQEGVNVTPISNKVVLVTGAAGSIGSELCRQILHYAPVKLVLVDNNESGLHDLVMELSTTEKRDVLQPVLADITNRATLKQVFEKYKPQVVFHSAAYKHVPMLEHYPDEAVRVNIGGTQQVAGLARDYKAERFVLISTDKAVNPSSVMGASKRVCELLMHAIANQKETRTLFTSVRFGNVLGSRGSVVPTFTRQIEAGGPVTVTHRSMTRYFMTIPEAVNLVIHAACLTKGDDLFMLQMGEVVRILDLVERMIRLRGLRPYIDISIKFTGMRPGEKLHEELHTATEDTVPTAHPFIVELNSRRNGLQPVSFSDRIHQLFQAGLDPERGALEQLQEVIVLGQPHHAEDTTPGAS
ncbi:MAG: polysaccharide biosynthesis protein [Anaerolineae bacterium]|nr:polysaccharide biosynthesis protein [Anaerolineae bacterium]